MDENILNNCFLKNNSWPFYIDLIKEMVCHFTLSLSYWEECFI